MQFTQINLIASFRCWTTQLNAKTEKLMAANNKYPFQDCPVLLLEAGRGTTKTLHFRQMPGTGTLNAIKTN